MGRDTIMKITDQKFYKDKNNQIYCFDIFEEDQESYLAFIQDDFVEITKEEAKLIANPPLSQQELDAKKEYENITFISSEINRTEAKLTQLYRLRDRNKASEIHLSQIEELEDYSADLMLVEDQDDYPLNAVFPTCPDFFSE